MIIVISEPNDVHAQAVLGELAKHRVRAKLLDLSEFPLKASLLMRLSRGTPGRFGMRLADGGTIDMGDVTGVWWRRPQAFGLPHQGMDPMARHFALVELATAFQGMWQASPALWVNDIVRDAAAAHKPWQLELAQSLGLSIPETVITNDPGEARAFWQRHPGGVIYKPFLQSFHSWRETRILRPEEERQADQIRLAPVIFQRYVPARADLRLTVIGDEIFAAEAAMDQSQYPVDVRLNNIPYQPHQLPDEVGEKVLALMRRLGLEYGAIDFRLTPDGDYVFLEINPAGQFLYVEHATGLPISAALAAHLARGVASSAGNPQQALRVA
ncbi:MAG: hypothetical protein R2909_00025 [Gemmatimonadales bacterium]